MLKSADDDNQKVRSESATGVTGSGTVSKSQPSEEFVDSRDKEYADAAANVDLRETIRCAVTEYREPDRLREGDSAPNLTLTVLEDKTSTRIGDWLERPLVLIFGSYT